MRRKIVFDFRITPASIVMVALVPMGFAIASISVDMSILVWKSVLG